MDSSKVPTLSETAFCICCKICETPEEESKRFLICGHSLCMYKYYHIRCLKHDQIASEAQVDKSCWYCPSCLCRICLIDMDDDKIILCDGCDEGYHLYCLSPPESSVPVGKWHCPSCQAQMKEEKMMEKYEERMLKLHRKDRDRAILKRGKYFRFDKLLSVAEILTAGEDEEPTAKEQSVTAASSDHGDCSL